MQQFEEALRADDSTYLGDTGPPNSPVVGPQHLAPLGQRVRKVSALSDFAPVNLKVKRWVYCVLMNCYAFRRSVGADVPHDPHTKAENGSISFSGGHYL